MRREEALEDAVRREVREETGIPRHPIDQKGQVAAAHGCVPLVPTGRDASGILRLVLSQEVNDEKSYFNCGSDCGCGRRHRRGPPL